MVNPESFFPERVNEKINFKDKCYNILIISIIQKNIYFSFVYEIFRYRLVNHIHSLLFGVGVPWYDFDHNGKKIHWSPLVIHFTINRPELETPSGEPLYISNLKKKIFFNFLKPKYLKIIIKKINYLIKIPLPNHTIPLTPTPNIFNKFSWKILFSEDLSTNNLNIR